MLSLFSCRLKLVSEEELRMFRGSSFQFLMLDGRKGFVV